jgi:hypothetical protein
MLYGQKAGKVHFQTTRPDPIARPDPRYTLDGENKSSFQVRKKGEKSLSDSSLRAIYLYGYFYYF